MEAGRPRISLQAQGRSRRRLLVNRGAESVAMLAAFGAIGVLGVVVVSVLLRGVPALNLDLLTKNQVTFGATGGGYLLSSRDMLGAVPRARTPTTEGAPMTDEAIIRSFPVARRPQHVVPSYDLKTLYVVSDLGNSLQPIDPLTGRPRPLPAEARTAYGGERG